MTKLVDGQDGTCRRCGEPIVWYFDRNKDAQIVEPYGLWLHAERMTEDCDAHDEAWHEPDE